MRERYGWIECTGSVQSVPSAASWRLITLNVSVRGSVAPILHEGRPLLGAEVGLLGEERAEGVRRRMSAPSVSTSAAIT